MVCTIVRTLWRAGDELKLDFKQSDRRNKKERERTETEEMTYGVSVRLWWRNGIKELLWYGDKDIHLLLRDGWSLAAT